MILLLTLSLQWGCMHLALCGISETGPTTDSHAELNLVIHSISRRLCFFDGITLHITHRMGGRHFGISRFILIFSIRYSHTVERSMGHVQTLHGRARDSHPGGSSGALFFESRLNTTKKDALGFSEPLDSK